jgi:hypothetical protein
VEDGADKRCATVAATNRLLTALAAEDLDLAQQYKKLLNNCNIPAAIKDHPDPESPFPGVAGSPTGT